MYNTDFPTRAELPSSGQLLRSTFLAIVITGGLLATVVLPAEYGIDPTGVGDRLGLTKMGEIKMQLAQEAQEDAENVAALEAADAVQTEIAQPEPRQTSAATAKENLAGEPIESLDVASRTEPASPPEETALSEKPTVETGPAPSADQGERLEASLPAEKVEAQARDETSFTLQPGEGAEIKADLPKNGKLAYFWTANGGVVNVDFHGEPHSNPRDSTLYRKERDVA